jgi:hypothetical protein
MVSHSSSVTSSLAMFSCYPISGFVRLTYSDKTFAPGYGEFYSAHEGDVEALALAVPTDALDGPPPAELQSLSTSAVGILENARLEDWEAASSTVKLMTTDWESGQATCPRCSKLR